MQTQFVNLLLIPIKISGRATALSRQKVHLIIRIDFTAGLSGDDPQDSKTRLSKDATPMKISSNLRT